MVYIVDGCWVVDYNFPWLVTSSINVYEDGVLLGFFGFYGSSVDVAKFLFFWSPDAVADPVFEPLRE